MDDQEFIFDRFLAQSKRISSAQKSILENAIRQGYLKVNEGRGDKIKNLYYRWCEESHHLYIVIEEGKITSTIHTDPTTYKKISNRSIEELFEIAVRYSNPYKDTITSLIFRHIPNDEAEQVVREILEIYESTDISNDINDNTLQKNITDQLQQKIKIPRKLGISGNLVRDRNIVMAVKGRANGFCELCKRQAPFKDYKGQAYLEVHHIDWLSRGGEDTVENAVALCPNCHKKMHILDSPEERAYLKKRANGK